MILILITDIWWTVDRYVKYKPVTSNEFSVHKEFVFLGTVFRQLLIPAFVHTTDSQHFGPSRLVCSFYTLILHDSTWFCHIFLGWHNGVPKDSGQGVSGCNSNEFAVSRVCIFWHVQRCLKNLGDHEDPKTGQPLSFFSCSVTCSVAYFLAELVGRFAGRSDIWLLNVFPVRCLA